MCRTARKRPRPTTLVLVTAPLPARYASAIEPKMLYITSPRAWETKGSARQATRGACIIEITRGYDGYFTCSSRWCLRTRSHRLRAQAKKPPRAPTGLRDAAGADTGRL